MAGKARRGRSPNALRGAFLATLLATFCPAAQGAAAAPPPCLPPSGASFGDEAPVPPPGWTVRAHRRYVAPDGRDDASGRTAETAWATLAANLARVPADTEIVFLNGVHESDRTLYRTERDAPPVDGLTLRAESWRGAVLRGTNTEAGSDDGIAIALLGGDRDVEVWGLVFEGWHGGGAGTVLADGALERFRFVGNRLRGNGSTQFHNMVYLSGGSGADDTQRDWLLSHNHVSLPKGSGSFVSIRGGRHGAHDGRIEHNRVDGDGHWAINVSNVRPRGSRSRILIRHNRFDGRFSQAVLQFADYNTPRVLEGVDRSFVVADNLLVNGSDAPTAHALWRWPPLPPGHSQHEPTLRGNRCATRDGIAAVAGFDR